MRNRLSKGWILPLELSQARHAMLIYILRRARYAFLLVVGGAVASTLGAVPYHTLRPQGAQDDHSRRLRRFRLWHRSRRFAVAAESSRQRMAGIRPAQPDFGV